MAINRLNPALKSPTEGTTELAAVLVAVSDISSPQAAAKVLTIQKAQLPSGPFSPIHSSLQAGVREWVEKQTHQPLGYIEQLYTFVNTHRTNSAGEYLIYIGYLGLVHEEVKGMDPEAKWLDWYRFFPWEDHRQGAPSAIKEAFFPQFARWVKSAPNTEEARFRKERLKLFWGFSNSAAQEEPYPWNEEYILQRYELLYEIGLIPESPHYQPLGLEPLLGSPMAYDHRRVLASGIARLRAKIKYRPVIFELMPPQFTLLQLQKSIEALGGLLLHKQNFRRQILSQNLIEETGEMATNTPGRPAKLYRFKKNILLERSLSGSKLPVSQ